MELFAIFVLFLFMRCLYFSHYGFVMEVWARYFYFHLFWLDFIYRRLVFSVVIGAGFWALILMLENDWAVWSHSLFVRSTDILF